MSLMEMRHRGWMHRARLDASKIAREKEDDTGDGTAVRYVVESVVIAINTSTLWYVRT